MVSTQEAYRKIGWRDESLFSYLPSIGKAAPAGFRLNFDRSAASFRADAQYR
jgi:hypothetical protein